MVLPSAWDSVGGMVDERLTQDPLSARGQRAASADPAIGTRVVDALAGLRPLAPFFCLYVTFGATLGFLSGGAPLILRARGVELAEVGLLQLINLPVGLTFLWAPLLDRLRLPFLAHRIGWIAAAQGAAIL